MPDLPIDISAGRRTLLAGSPEGQDARLIAQLAEQAGSRGVLHVALDDARMARLAQSVAFFHPGLEVISFPAWDCLPYDRVSPNPEIVSRRIGVLSRLATSEQRKGAAPRLVLTTVNALLQRIPPAAVFAAAAFEIRAGARFDLDAFNAFVARQGYTRTQTVREPGELAVRGGIIDIWPPGRAEPVRLDLFGDEIEAIRSFDPMTQRTTGPADRADLRPMSELTLDPESIARFRSAYRAEFGAVTGTDPLYEAVSEGRRYIGMEHWLPLFHERMAMLPDYLPGAGLSLDHQAEDAVAARLQQVAEFHEARAMMQQAKGADEATLYKPLPADSLYLSEGEWTDLLQSRTVFAHSPFAPLPGADAVEGGARKGRDFADARAKADTNVFDAVRDHVSSLMDAGRRVIVAGYSAGTRERLGALLRDHGLKDQAAAETWPEAMDWPARRVVLAVLPLESGFAAQDVAVVTEQDILGDRLARPARRKRRADNFIAEVSGLSTGDLVVHAEHGIGRYQGLETLTVSGAPHDCLRLIYADNDKLFVPVENIEVLSRFGSEDAGVALDKLGGAGWQARKARVKRRLKDMAEALVRLAAQRSLCETTPQSPPSGLYDEFSARFPYPETDDQVQAIDQVIEDLATGRPMDRLICGDVGFGKTEVALRAAFIAAANSQQVAVVVPTTLLARQHFRTFQDRFRGFPIRVEHLSRMVSAKDAKQVRDGLRDGSVDIIVGTHALLSKTVAFKRLGLLIVDEEQHFGVKQKERLKELAADVHVLTLTATPIPRTLQLALAGVRELSLIATPPVDRLAVRTFVLPYDPVIVREAIMREHFRGGQTYYVCPRIDDLDGVLESLKRLVPEVKVAVAHGRMAPSVLENVMTDFYEGRFDILLSTTIVESGLDIPSANTLILHRSDMFGLSQLYQLRGRIGRSKVRGYAYLTYSSRRPLSAAAVQRLHVIDTLDTLGAGFTLASHDLDIRGAGNLLGEEQSGHIREVGMELYQQMLEDAVAAARRGELTGIEEEGWTPSIHLGMPVLIPETYIADLEIRLDIYRRIAKLVDHAEIEGFAAELIDRFGALPAEVDNLLAVIGLKRQCKAAGIERLEAGPKGAVIQFRNNIFANPEKLVRYVQKQHGAAKIRPDHRLVLMRPWSNPANRMKGVARMVDELVGLAT